MVVGRLHQVLILFLTSDTDIAAVPVQEQKVPFGIWMK